MIGRSVNAGYLNTTLLHSSRSGKRSVPVRPSHSYYARFKHVIGVPAGKESNQVPLHKLRVLDNFISHLINVRSHSGKTLMLEGIPDNGGKVPVDSENVDDLIADIGTELREAGSTGYSERGTHLRTAIPETGEVINILA